jgi:hypothetical protein
MIGFLEELHTLVNKVSVVFFGINEIENDM